MWWCGCAGFGQCYLVGVVDRVLGVRARYLVLGCVIWLVVGAGLRVRGCAGLRVLGCVIRLVWLCGCAGFRQRYLVGVVDKLAGGCGCAGICRF